MERLPLKPLFLLGVVALGLAGCTGGSEATTTQSEEEMFKNPGPVDRSKIPAGGGMPKGKPFIGEPSGAMGGGGKPPPPSVTGG